MAARRPTDRVVAAIQDLKDRGFSVTFYPFIAMDIPAGNSLPDPYTGAHRPAALSLARAHHLRAGAGRGRHGRTRLRVRRAGRRLRRHGGAADFSIDGEEVAYSGPDEWSFRRFILHCARLCEAAGGVDAFIIGSEMRGATQAPRQAPAAIPFVDALVDLAADVQDVLGPATMITYAADWTEYFGLCAG